MQATCQLDFKRSTKQIIIILMKFIKYHLILFALLAIKEALSQQPVPDSKSNENSVELSGKQLANDPDIFSCDQKGQCQNKQADFLCKIEGMDFTIQIDFTSDRVPIRLTDFNKGVIYERLYTTQDIGKEINPYLSLFELYSSIVPFDYIQILKKNETVCQFFNESWRLNNPRQNNIHVLTLTESGSIRIESEIVIKASYTTVEKKISILNLKKVGVMSQYDKILTKTKKMMLASEQSLMKHFKQQIENISIHLQKQINYLKYGDSSLINQNSSMSIQMVVPKDIFSVLKQQNQRLKAENTVLKQANPFLADLRGPSSYMFYNINKRITYTGPDQQWNQLLRSAQIKLNKKYRFKARIEKSMSNHMMIGITDRVSQIAKSYSYDSINTLTYYGSNGHIYPKQRKMGSGFKASDIVEVKVNRMNATVQWYVNYQLVAEENNDMLKQKNREFVPCFEFYRTGDIIQFIDDEYFQ